MTVGIFFCLQLFLVPTKMAFDRTASANDCSERTVQLPQISLNVGPILQTRLIYVIYCLPNYTVYYTVEIMKCFLLIKYAT